MESIPTPKDIKCQVDKHNEEIYKACRQNLIKAINEATSLNFNVFVSYERLPDGIFSKLINEFNKSGWVLTPKEFEPNIGTVIVVKCKDV